VCHAAGVKMETVKADTVTRSEKGKDLLVIKGFKFRFQKILADKMERWCCTTKKCKCYIKCNESREIFGGDVMHNHGENSEACLNPQILNNSVKGKAMEDLCKRPRNVIHKELQCQDLDTLTYIKTHRTLAGISIQHAPPNCFLSQQTLKKLTKH
jgi:hypothetical protein